MSNILILEDEHNLAQLLKDLLTLEGHTVSAPQSFDNVLQSIDASSPDAIVMDIHLQDIDGLEIVRQIRQDPKFHMLYILTFSGLDISHRALAAGANDFLQKPFMPDEIINRLNSNINS